MNDSVRLLDHLGHEGARSLDGGAGVVHEGGLHGLPLPPQPVAVLRGEQRRLAVVPAG